MPRAAVTANIGVTAALGIAVGPIYQRGARTKSHYCINHSYNDIQISTHLLFIIHINSSAIHHLPQHGNMTTQIWHIVLAVILIQCQDYQRGRTVSLIFNFDTQNHILGIMNTSYQKDPQIDVDYRSIQHFSCKTRTDEKSTSMWGSLLSVVAFHLIPLTVPHHDTRMLPSYLQLAVAGPDPGFTYDFRRNVSWVMHSRYNMSYSWLRTQQVGKGSFPLWWRHNDQDSVSNHQPDECLLNRLFRRTSRKTSKLRVTGLCVGNSPGPVNSPHKGPVTRKMFPFDDVIMHNVFLNM